MFYALKAKKQTNKYEQRVKYKYSKMRPSVSMDNCSESANLSQYGF